MSEANKIEIYLSSSPHATMKPTTRHVMALVVLSLLPIVAYGVYLFGVPALVTTLVAVASCVVFEALFRKIIGSDVRVGDLSAVITGLLLAMVLPPSIPVWMTALGSLFAIVVAKEFFGGLGANVFNPALAGRAFLMVSFTTPMTTWMAPRSGGLVDAVSNATPLAMMKGTDGVAAGALEIADRTGLFSGADVYWNLFLGRNAGCIGESAIFLILIAFVLLSLAKVIDWRSPVAMLATAVAITWAAGVDPLLTLLSGGLAFGAVFMVTDYATSPVTPAGRLLFGAGCGLITALIRLWGGFPEGVMFSILIMNAVVPYLDRIITRKYGWVRPVREGRDGKKGSVAK